MQEATETYYCPVCGVGLFQSDLDRPEEEYYCRGSC